MWHFVEIGSSLAFLFCILSISFTFLYIIIHGLTGASHPELLDELTRRTTRDQCSIQCCDAATSAQHAVFMAIGSGLMSETNTDDRQIRMLGDACGMLDTLRALLRASLRALLKLCSSNFPYKTGVNWNIGMDQS